MKRRLALLTAIFMLVFSLSALADGFSDMPAQDSKYYKAFEYALSKKLIAGDGTNLNPESYITAAEALTIISRIKPFDCEETDITQFGVAKDKWYYSTVAKAYTLGYIPLDFDGKLYPEKSITRISANNIIGKVYGKAPTPWPSNEWCTRADFIWEIYFKAPDGKYAAEQTPSQEGTEAPTEAPTEASSEGATEAPTEFTDLKAKAAQEAMQVALGIRADGSSYVTVTAYKDVSNTDWTTGRVSSSSRPSSGSSRPSGGNSSEDETEAPTEDDSEDETQKPTNEPSEPTGEPTEPPTQEPTYGEYDGPIDNDKDNVIDDPFNDGWTPPGVGGDTGNIGEGGGGYDEEDEDFTFNDDDDPDYVQPTEDKTEAPSETESDTETESETETDAPSETESDTETDSPSETESDTETESETETDTPSETESDTETESETETDAPSETESDTDSDTETDTETPALPPSEEESSDESENDENDEDLSDDSESQPLSTKVWWFK